MSPRGRLYLIGFALAAALSWSAACGSDATDPCDAMVKHLESCGLQGSGGGFNCTGEAACAADCVTQASCDDIKMNGKPYIDCLDACGAK